MGSRTWETIGKIEDISDVLTNISPKDTPLYSKFAKGEARGMDHSWLTDSLRAPGDNKHAEDAVLATAAVTPRVKLTNSVQIFQGGYWVTESQQAILKAGVKDELGHQMKKCFAELALDVEYAYVNNSDRQTSSQTTVGQLGGLPYFNTVNVVDNGGVARTLTETLLNDTMQLAWQKGGKPDLLVASGKNKRIISGFTAGTLKTKDMDEKKLSMVVEVYETDFGVVRTLAHRLYPNTHVDILQTDLFKTCYLIPFKTVPLPKDSLKLGKNVNGQLTLECRSKDAHARITDLE